MKSKLHIAAIALVLLFFAAVPQSFIAYGGLGLLLGGLMILAPLIALQFIVLKLIQRWSATQASKTRDSEV